MSNPNKKTPLIAVRLHGDDGRRRDFLMTASGGRLPEIKELHIGVEPPGCVRYWEPGDAPLKPGRALFGVTFVEYQGIVFQSIEEAVSAARQRLDAESHVLQRNASGTWTVIHEVATPEVLEAMALLMRHGVVNEG